MSDEILIESLDETYVLVSSPDRGIQAELKEYFSFKVPGAQFSPAYKNKVWDGKIRLYQEFTGRIYKGLVDYVERFAADRSYTVHYEKGLKRVRNEFDVETFLKSLDLKLDPYAEQKSAVKHAIESERCVLLSPTSSGKSLIQYAITRYYFDALDKKILICVPTIGLVTQMYEDFKDYSDSFDVENNVHSIYEGQSKKSDKKIFISTWQSIYKQNKDFFEQFDLIMVDECHTMKADAMKGILERSVRTKYRIGLTGTLDGTECHRLVTEGLTGSVYSVTTTNELMKQGKVSQMEILCLVMKYNEAERKAAKKFKYNEEMSFIVSHANRNKVISNLVRTATPDRNILILTAYKEHLKILKEVVEKTGKKVYTVSGSTKADEREAIRKLAEVENGIVIIATYGVYSTGVNIKNLQYIIKATPSKSVIRVLQSIGRGLRKDGKFNTLKVIDLIDDFGWKNTRNFLYDHFFERIKIYIAQKFVYKLKNINI